MLKLFRAHLLLVATIVVAIALLGLVVVSTQQPTASPAAGEWQLDQTAYTVLVDAFSALLGVGLLSLIFELFLRESYAEALQDFLRMNSAITRSGLKGIGNAAPDLAEELKAASTIKAIVRDPQSWVLSYFTHVLHAATHRQTTILLVFPDPRSPSFAAVAESLDVTEAELQSGFDLALTAMQQRWGTVGKIHPGSTIKVYLTALPLYEVTCIDESAVCVFDASAEHRQGGKRLSLRFETEGDPVAWLVSQIDVLATGGEYWEADARTPAASRRNQISNVIHKPAAGESSIDEPEDTKHEDLLSGPGSPRDSEDGS